MVAPPVVMREERSAKYARSESPVGSDLSVAAFFAIAYLLAWGIWAALSWFAGDAGMDAVTFVAAIEDGNFDVGGDTPGWLLYLLTRILDFSFTIAGLIMIGLTGGLAGFRQLGARLTTWRIPIRWYAAGLIPVALYGVAAVVASSGSGGGAILNLSTVNTILFSLSSGFFVSLFLRGAMGEEIGLRGFALVRLQERTTPTKASLIVGVLWALWHLPVLAPRGPVTAVLLILLIVGVSFVFTWLFNGSGGSLVPPLLFHAAQNWEEGFEVVFPAIVDTNWDTPATLALLPVALVVGLRIRGRGESD